ncbi:MAG: Gfo/Idh/MocA family oxidoreductase [Ktedonobacterales bacterium]|nr:Gfo/Idh/MocA family oxidoreductase [Ktedonobacterales bacterium]
MATYADRAIRWGILGTGGIAEKFAEGLAVLDDAELVAVGSRSAASAATFGERYAVPHRHATYAELASDPDVDVIYVSTPHPFHKDNSLLCLAAGKAVLCEKPFMINASEAAEVITFARERQLFLMEAMWVRFLPIFVHLRDLLSAGAIGDIQVVHADFSFRAEFDPAGRLFDPALGGGALLDAGIYPVSLASMLLGPPSEIVSQSRFGATGVDEQAAILQRYQQGQLAVLTTATRNDAPQEILICGTTGYIRLVNWLGGTTMTITRPQQPDEQIQMPLTGNGYNYEAAEVMRCLRAGLLESPIMPLDESLALMHNLDAIRAPWGLRYPSE